MPRSIKKPQVGHMVWYYANPAPAAPLAAIVAQTVDWSDATDTGHFNLSVLAAAGTWSAVTNVAFTNAGGVYQFITAAVVAAGGSGYAIGDTITLSNGIVLRVLTLSTTAVATVAILNAGQSVSASPPANPVAQVSTSGAGTGATFTLTWASGAWCTYPRAYESTSSLQPAMAFNTEHSGKLSEMGYPGFDPPTNGDSEPKQIAKKEADDDDDDGDDDDDEPSSRSTTRSRTVTRERTTHR